MGLKSDRTPNYLIKAALRRHVWLKSRERAAALKRDNYTCQCCKRKQTRAKGEHFLVEVHHKDGIMLWNQIFDVIKTALIPHHDSLVTLCKGCHKNLHADITEDGYDSEDDAEETSDSCDNSCD